MDVEAQHQRRTATSTASRPTTEESTEGISGLPFGGCELVWQPTLYERKENGA